MIKIIIQLFFAYALCFSAQAQTVLDFKTQQHSTTALGPYLEYAVSDNTNITAEQLQQNPKLLDFTAFTGSSMPAFKEYVWFRFSVRNNSPEQQTLVVNFDELVFDDLVFSYRFNNEWVQYQAGLNWPYSKRPINYRFLAMPLRIDANDTQTVYFRAYSSYLPLVAPTLSSSLDFVSATSASAIINLLFIGVGIGLCIFLAIYMPFTMPLYEAYSFIIHVFATTLVIVSVSGMLQFILPEQPHWHRYLLVALLAFNALTNMLMVNVFFQVYKLNPKLQKAYLAIAPIFITFIVGYPLLGGYTALMFPLVLCTFIVFILLFITSIYKYRQGYPHAGLFLASIGAFFCACMYAFLGAEGYLPYSSTLRHGIGASIIIQAAIICIAFAKKAYTNRKKSASLAQEIAIANAASRDKSLFLATMSHEIRTPVNGVLGMAQMLQLTALDEQQQHYAGVILNSGKTLLAVIDDILDFSKVEAGKITLNQSVFNFPELITYTEALFRPQALNKNLAFNVYIDKRCPNELFGDATRLQQVLNNLLSNAFKFTHQGKIDLSISVSAIDAEQVRLLFHVRDSGIGINSLKHDQLFQAFTQADDSTTRTYGGTGLGLAISQKLVSLMQGEIGFISEEGAGADFWFSAEFSRAKRSMSVLKQKKIARNLEAGDESKPRFHVLVAEDNQTNQQVILAMLKLLDIDVSLTEDGIEAVATFEQEHEKFDAILMDLEMPNKDGYAATAAIRSLEQALQLKATPIIALTAHVMQDNIQRCFDAGMDKVLTKPIQLNKLKQALIDIGVYAE